MRQPNKIEQKIIDGFKKYGNHTAKEMGELLNIQPNVISARINELYYELYLLEKKGTGIRKSIIWGVADESKPMTTNDILERREERNGNFEKIKLERKTYERLVRRREQPDESWDDVINRIIDTGKGRIKTTKQHTGTK